MCGPSWQLHSIHNGCSLKLAAAVCHMWTLQDVLHMDLKWAKRLPWRWWRHLLPLPWAICLWYGECCQVTLYFMRYDAMLPRFCKCSTIVACHLLIWYLDIMQVSNKLSLGGASLVCSCTVVLALAEHLSAAKTNQQSAWWHKAWTKFVDWSADYTRRLVCFWHACHRNRALYERVYENDPDSSNWAWRNTNKIKKYFGSASVASNQTIETSASRFWINLLLDAKGC